MLEGSLGWEKPLILCGEWAVEHEISQTGAGRWRLLPGLLRTKTPCSAASEDLAGWSLLCPEMDVSLGPEPRISAANEGTEGGGEGWPGSKPDSPAGAIETELAAVKTFLRFLPGQWRGGLL